jgi:fatty acid desaturase
MSTPRVLSGPEIRNLSGRSDLRGALRTLGHAAFIALGVGLVASAGPWTLVPAMIVLGVGLATLFAPIHETMHLTAFKSRRANAIVGWIVACPSLLNWHFYTVFHLAHHRHTQDPALDPELTPPPPGAWGGYIARVSGLNYWRARLAVVRDCWRGDLSAYPYIPARAAARIIRSVRLMSALMVALSALSMALIGWWAPLVFWILPQMLGQPLLRLYLLTEHTGCSLDDNGLTNTRTTLTNLATRLLMWNMGYHTEHHLYPSIPFHRLPAAHGAVRNRLGVVQHGYLRWHLGFVRSLHLRSPRA